VGRPRSRRLLLARDPLGQKPLYFCQASGALSLRVGGQALLASKRIRRRRSNLDGMGHYMALRYLPDQHTMFAGHPQAARRQRGSAIGATASPTIQRYWTLAVQPKTGLASARPN
jgi:asparagine synthetase B (glutamine-hydrolysing)